MLKCPKDEKHFVFVASNFKVTKPMRQWFDTKGTLWATPEVSVAQTVKCRDCNAPAIEDEG